MKKAYAVIGAGFGDEGKGLMTDYFCRRGGSVINIRSNGGAQAGHTVCTAGGKRHIFSHIGSGSFAGADTYLSGYFILNPMLFSRELQILGADAGRIFIDRQCIITLPCDMLLNQFAETVRGSNRHGSCGVGIFETSVRSRDSRYRLEFGDILQADRNAVRSAMHKIHAEYCIQRADELGITGAAKAELTDMLANVNLTENYIDDLYAMAAVCIAADGLPLVEDVGGLHGYTAFLRAIHPTEERSYWAEHPEEQRPDNGPYETKQESLAWAKGLGWKDKVRVETLL